MNRITEKPKTNPAESVRQRLKNLSKEKGRPFDEILRYYAMERFLYRLSVSPYVGNFFLKGGLMLKVWNAVDHRATMDIDLLARTPNQIENLQRIITEVAGIAYEEDAITFHTDKLILRSTQTTGDYNGVSCSFSAKLFTTNIPLLIDLGFSDVIIPKPQKIQYPTLLGMPTPTLFGYTLETVIAEKFEAIIKLAFVNTRMKDFYDIWTLMRQHELERDSLKNAIVKVCSRRKTPLKYPVAFTPAFYDTKEAQQRWNNFLATMGKEPIPLKHVIAELAEKMEPFLAAAK